MYHKWQRRHSRWNQYKRVQASKGLHTAQMIAAAKAEQQAKAAQAENQDLSSQAAQPAPVVYTEF